jgi:hypothetical protein
MKEGITRPSEQAPSVRKGRSVKSVRPNFWAERRPRSVGLWSAKLACWYKPLFWGGLWGIPFGLLIKPAWMRLYLFGFLYFLLPVLALFVIFLPMSGAGYFGLQAGGPKLTLYLLLVNLPYGIITALAARAIIGKQA